MRHGVTMDAEGLKAVRQGVGCIGWGFNWYMPCTMQ